MGSDRSVVAGSGPLGVASPSFDPVWGTLGAVSPQGGVGSFERDVTPAGGSVVEVDLLGNDLHISSEIDMGQFARLSDWLNMQSGFVPVWNAVELSPGTDGVPGPDPRPGVLWVRLNQIVIVADRSTIQKVRPGAPIVQKERRRVVIVTHGYEVRGSIHLHADGDMARFLEAADPHFLSMTDVTVAWPSEPRRIDRFSYALVNREQVITVLEDSQSPADELVSRDALSA